MFTNAHPLNARLGSLKASLRENQLSGCLKLICMGGATSILRAVGKLHDTARVQTARARAPQNLWRAIRVGAA